MSRQFSSHQEHYPSRGGGTLGGDRKAATALVFQAVVAGVASTVTVQGDDGAIIAIQATVLNTDQIIINAAIFWVNALGGGSIYVEESVYTLGATITMLASVYLYSVGENTLITGAGNFHLITINGVDDCTVEMIRLSHTLVAGNFECISIDESDRFYIRRVRIIDSPRFGIGGAALTTMTDGWVVDCHISGTEWEGISFFMAAANLITNLFIRGNYIANTGQGGPIGVSRAERPLITDNITEGTGGFAGIYIELGTSSIVADNIIDDNTGAGIFLDDGDNANVTGNIVFSSSFQGIRADNLENSVFDGNSIYEAVANGFFLNGCVNNSFTDNMVQGCGDDGLELDADCDFNEIHGNNFIGNTGFGINITAGATENDCRDNYYSGNTAGMINDLGTDTRVHELVVPPSETNSFIGRHPTAQMLDNVETVVRFGFPVSDGFQELVTAQVVVIPAANGDLRRAVDTDYGKVCSGEDYDEHSDAIAAGQVAGLTADELECIDVSAALDTPDIAQRDTVGMEFSRDATGGSGDTIVGTVHVKEFRLRYV